MALSDFARRMTQTSVERNPSTTEPLPRPSEGEKKSLDADVEGGNPQRRMSRIDKKEDDHPSDSDSTVSIGAQIELEKDNAIKYRTCSWQKVRILYPSPVHAHSCPRQGGMSHCARSITQNNLMTITRLHSCSSPSIFAWLSCRSHGHIRSSA